MTFLFSKRETHLDPQTPKIEGDTTIINQDQSGNFLALGVINDIPVSMLIDTGASTIVVSKRLARKAGLTENARIRVVTANGVAEGYSSIVDVIQIGNLIGRNIEAIVVPNMQISHALIGMSFLENINFQKRRNQLILSPLL